MSKLQITALAVAGLTALGIGGFILAAPHAFYASYGIALGADPNMLSELRSPAASLGALGLVMLAGIWRRQWTQTSAAVALAVFIAFPVGRVVSLAADGMPSTSVLAALAIELAIAALCLAAFWRTEPKVARDPVRVN